MKQHWLIWIPRILAILLGVVLFAMSLDVFGSDDGFGKQLLGFLIHNIPAMIWALVLWLTWKRPLIAGLLFFLLGAAFTLFFGTYAEGWESLLIISGVPLLIAILFFISYLFAPRTDHHGAA